MPDLDLAIRGGTVVTAADVPRCDIGIRDGKIAIFAESLPEAARTLDPTGLLVMPGGIDSRPSRHGADYTPWEGYEANDWPVRTVLRGKLIYEEGAVLGSPGGGQFLKRGLPPFASPQRSKGETTEP